MTGRSRAAGSRRAGRSVRTGKEQTFFPSHSASTSRASLHYGKNYIVLSGIGTDRPARPRPAALDRPGTPGRAWARRAPAVARDDMMDVNESAVDKNASFRRIRQSTRCQQKGAVEAADDPGGRLPASQRSPHPGGRLPASQRSPHPGGRLPASQRSPQQPQSHRLVPSIFTSYLPSHSAHPRARTAGQLELHSGHPGPQACELGPIFKTSF